MTKRDVAVWFCKVVALVGMAGAIASALQSLVGWPYFGVAGILQSILPFGLYLFVWFLSRGIGTELAAEGEYGQPITSAAELGQLLLRCVGLWLFLSASIVTGPTLLAAAFEYFTSGRFSLFGSNATAHQFTMVRLVVGLLESVIGFLLAFTPRLRAFLSK